MIRRPPNSTRTDTLFPYTTLFRSSSRVSRLCPCDPNSLHQRFAAHLVRRFFKCSLILRSEEHTSELQSLMRNLYAVFCLQKKRTIANSTHNLYLTEITYGEGRRLSTVNIYDQLSSA